MKDAKGHGSDAHGMANRETAGNHQTGVLRIGRPVPPAPNTALIQARDRVSFAPMTVWGNVRRVGLARPNAGRGYGGSTNPKAKAERVALAMQADKRRLVPRGADYAMRVR
jgi:hypothetical protein